MVSERLGCLGCWEEGDLTRSANVMVDMQGADSYQSINQEFIVQEYRIPFLNTMYINHATD